MSSFDADTRERTLDEVLRGLRSENDTLQMRAVIASVEALKAGSASQAGAMSSFDLQAHLQRQAAFSQSTFGPGYRTGGVCDHIRKELAEVQAAADQGQPTLPEWIDVIILAFDGALRVATAEQVIAALVAKQRTNEERTWPDWRTADPNKAIEHDRQGEEAAPEMVPVSLEWLRGIQQRLDLILQLQKKQKQRNTGMFL